MKDVEVIKMLIADLRSIYREHLELVDIVMPPQMSIKLKADINRDLMALEELDERYDNRYKIDLSDLNEALGK